MGSENVGVATVPSDTLKAATPLPQSNSICPPVPTCGTSPLMVRVVQFAMRPEVLVIGGKVCVNRSAAKTALVVTTMTAIAPRIILVFKIPSKETYENGQYLTR